MPRSRLQDYLSLNKLHYGFYYPGIQSQENKQTTEKNPKKQQHFAGLLFTRTLVPSALCRLAPGVKAEQQKETLQDKKGKIYLSYICQRAVSEYFRLRY